MTVSADRIRLARGRGCPTPGKIAYPDRETAENVLRLNRRIRGVVTNTHRRRKHERRAYRCVCGHWHLTSRGTWSAEPPG